MTYIPLPRALLDSREYTRIQPGARKLLIDLYVLFGDQETFIVNVKRPEQYRQTAHSDLCGQLRRLIDSGLLEVANAVPAQTWNRRRVFRFKHSAISAYAEFGVAA